MPLTRTQEQIGAALRRRRRELGLTQEGLAEHIHARQGTVSSLESGTVDSKLSTLLDVLAALDLELVVQPRSKREASDFAAEF